MRRVLVVRSVGCSRGPRAPGITPRGRRAPGRRPRTSRSRSSRTRRRGRSPWSTSRRARSSASSTSIRRARRAEGPGAPNYAQDTDVSPDGRTLYVSRGYLGDVAAFDIASGRLLWQRSLNTGRADHMTLTPDGRSLFVSAMHGQPRLPDRDRDRRDHRSSGDRRLSARQQGLEGRAAAVQHEPRRARRAAALCRRSAAHGDAGGSVPADDRRRRHAGDSRSHPARQRVPSVAVQRRTRRASTRSCRTSTRSSPTISRRGRWSAPRAAGEARHHRRRLGLRGAASRPRADGGRQDAVPRWSRVGLCRVGRARRT